MLRFVNNVVVCEQCFIMTLRENRGKGHCEVFLHSIRCYELIWGEFQTLCLNSHCLLHNHLRIHAQSTSSSSIIVWSFISNLFFRHEGHLLFLKLVNTICVSALQNLALKFSQDWDLGFPQAFTRSLSNVHFFLRRNAPGCWQRYCWYTCLHMMKVL